MPEIFEVTVRSGEDICKTISDFVTSGTSCRCAAQ